MKCKSVDMLAAGLICFGLLAASPVLATEGYVERGYAIVQAVNESAGKIAFKGNEYVVVSTTQVLNEVGMPGRLSDFEPMMELRGVPDRDSGTKIYFEADDDHRLLKLHIVKEIPS